MSWHRGLSVSAALAVLLSCGGQEQRTLSTFFQALQSGDRAALRAISRVEFPHQVASWEVVETGPESVEPFRLPEFSGKARQAKVALDFHLEKVGNFQRDNASLYEEYQKRLEKDPNYQFTGKLGQLHEQWVQLEREQNELEAALEAANAELDKEKNSAAISLMGSSVTETLDGNVAGREMVVMVKTADGGEKRFRFTVRKYDLVEKQTKVPQRSRWIIADIQEQAT